MILVTVGMQLPFDRLVRAMDEIAPQLSMPVIAQTDRGSYSPMNIDAKQSLAPQEFEMLASNARLIISHAGIGTVLTARRLCKPIVILPRRASLGEHRNDHQLATARQLAEREGIIVAFDVADLPDAIRAGLSSPAIEHRHSPRLDRLTNAVAEFISGSSSNAL